MNFTITDFILHFCFVLIMKVEIKNLFLRAKIIQMLSKAIKRWKTDGKLNFFF